MVHILTLIFLLFYSPPDRAPAVALALTAVASHSDPAEYSASTALADQSDLPEDQASTLAPAPTPVSLQYLAYLIVGVLS